MEALDNASVVVFLAYVPLIQRLELQEEQLDLLSMGSAKEHEDSPLVLLEKFYLFWEVLVNPPLPKVLSLSNHPCAAEYHRRAGGRAGALVLLLCQAHHSADGS